MSSLDGVRWARARLCALPTAMLAGAAASVVLVSSIVERRATPQLATDRTLVDVTFGWVFPLAALLLCRRFFTAPPTMSFDCIARYGADRRRLFRGASAVLLLSAASLGAALASATALATGTSTADLVTCVWIGALAGVAYCGWYTLASTYGDQAQGAWVVFALDWILGASHGFVGLFWPRGHLRNLLGAAPVLDLSQPQASAVLLLGGLTGLALTAWRVAP